MPSRVYRPASSASSSSSSSLGSTPQPPSRPFNPYSISSLRSAHASSHSHGLLRSFGIQGPQSPVVEAHVQDPPSGSSNTHSYSTAPLQRSWLGNGATRSRLRLADYLTVPPDEMEVDPGTEVVAIGESGREVEISRRDDLERLAGLGEMHFRGRVRREPNSPVTRRSGSMPPLADPLEGDDDHDGDTEVDIDGLLDHAGVSGGVMEGVRVENEALFDALTGGGNASNYPWRTSPACAPSWSRAHFVSPQTNPFHRQGSTPHPPELVDIPSTVSRSDAQSTPHSNARSRTSDFNDFTSRRRISTREREGSEPASTSEASRLVPVVASRSTPGSRFGSTGLRFSSAPGIRARSSWRTERDDDASSINRSPTSPGSSRPMPRRRLEHLPPRRSTLPTPDSSSPPWGAATYFLPPPLPSTTGPAMPMASTAGDEVLAPRVAPATISRALQAQFEQRRERRRLDNGMTTLGIRALRREQELRTSLAAGSRASTSTSAAGPSVVDEHGDGTSSSSSATSTGHSTSNNTTQRDRERSHLSWLTNSPSHSHTSASLSLAPLTSFHVRPSSNSSPPPFPSFPLPAVPGFAHSSGPNSYYSYRPGESHGNVHGHSPPRGYTEYRPFTELPPPLEPPSPTASMSELYADVGEILFGGDRSPGRASTTGNDHERVSAAGGGSGTEMGAAPPRLRRGGVRPPEMISASLGQAHAHHARAQEEVGGTIGREAARDGFAGEEDEGMR